MKRQTKVALNVGLENWPENLTLKIAIENHIYTSFGKPTEKTPYSFGIDTGIYNGQTEETLVIEFITPYKLSKTVEKVEKLALVLNQDCIGAKIDENSEGRAVLTVSTRLRVAIYLWI